MSYIKKILAITLIIFCNQASFARFATHEEAAVETLYDNSEIYIKKNGTYEYLVETEYKILNEIGRKNYGSTTLYFTKDISNIEVLEAKTIVNDEEFKINPADIEVKPLASSEKGFDQQYQILISFPKANVGARLYLKYKGTVHTPVLDNHYSSTLSFGTDSYLSKSKTKIKSEIPLNYLVNDPNKSLKIDFSSKDGITAITIDQVKPIFTEITNESASSQLDGRQVTYVSLSSFSNIESLGDILATEYEKILSQPLPDLFEAIAKDAANFKEESDQINHVISSIIDKIRYMGSWQTIKGKIYPRDLKLIADSGYGDCKEFATSSAAILRTLGYQADVSLVYRENSYIENDNILPNMGLFNHLILRVVGKSGKTYWLDPTNFTVMSNGIYSDIANRKALVLSTDMPLYELIPQIDYRHSLLNKLIETSFEGDKISTNIKLEIKGEKAINLTGAELTTSKAVIEENMIKYVADEANPISKKITLPDLKSRIVSDKLIEIFVKKLDDHVQTNLGKGYLLSSPNNSWNNILRKVSNNDVGIIRLESPFTENTKIILKNFSAKNPENLNFEIKSKWFNVQRTLSQENTNLVVEEKVELINPVILPEDMKSEEFHMLQNEMRILMQDALLVMDE